MPMGRPNCEFPAVLTCTLVDEESPSTDGPHQADCPQVHRRQGPAQAAGHQGCARLKPRLPGRKQCPGVGPRKVAGGVPGSSCPIGPRTARPPLLRALPAPPRAAPALTPPVALPLPSATQPRASRRPPPAASRSRTATGPEPSPCARSASTRSLPSCSSASSPSSAWSGRSPRTSRCVGGRAAVGGCLGSAASPLHLLL
jgi:hypothetical protein